MAFRRRRHRLAFRRRCHAGCDCRQHIGVMKRWPRLHCTRARACRWCISSMCRNPASLRWRLTFPIRPALCPLCRHCRLYANSFLHLLPEKAVFGCQLHLFLAEFLHQHRQVNVWQLIPIFPRQYVICFACTKPRTPFVHVRITAEIDALSGHQKEARLQDAF